jgi:hypothetical protein
MPSCVVFHKFIILIVIDFTIYYRDIRPPLIVTYVIKIVEEKASPFWDDALERKVDCSKTEYYSYAGCEISGISYSSSDFVFNLWRLSDKAHGGWR